nr:DNA translocase FtsK 4TM domain-containing protein [Bacteroidota bacterium]
MPSKTNKKRKEEKANQLSSGKEKTRKRFRNPLAGTFSFLQNRQFQQILGLFLILVSFIFALSFTSYLSTWKGDDTLFNKSFIEILKSDELPVENMMGKLGAALSNVFMRQGFGVASYFFVIFFFMAGIRLVWPLSRVPVWRTFKVSLLGLVWFSTAIAYFLPNKMNGILHGWFGYVANSWMISTIGAPGTLLILLFILVSFLIIIGFFRIFNFKLPPLTFISQKTGTKKGKPAQKEPKENFDTNRDNNIEFDDPKTYETQSNYGKNIPLVKDFEDTGTTELNGSDYDKLDKNIDFTIENADIQKTDEEPDRRNTEIHEKPVKSIDRQGLDTNYDPRMDLPTFQFPTLNLLNDYGDEKINVKQEELENNKNRIVKTLSNYNIDIDKIKATIGPTVTLYEIVPAAGVRISKIKNLEDDIALS